ncbi:MAG: AraC family transcriptional regulator [Myxococcota bacterium]
MILDAPSRAGLVVTRLGAPRGAVASAHAHQFHQVLLPECASSVRFEDGATIRSEGAPLVWPADRRGVVECDPDFRALAIRVSAGRLRETARLLRGSDELSWKMCVPEDPFLTQAARRLLVVAASGASPVMVTSLQTAIAHHLILMHAAKRSSTLPHRIQRVLAHIESHLSDPLRVADLAAVACMPRRRFARYFRSIVGKPPYLYVRERRLVHARTLLASSATIVDVALRCGFASQSHLTRAFKAHYGETPGAFRRRAMASAR